jgi:hypothetical protein
VFGPGVSRLRSRSPSHFSKLKEHNLFIHNIHTIMCERRSTTGPRHTTSVPHSSVPCPPHPYHFTLSFPRPAQMALFRASWLSSSCLLLVRSVVCVRASGYWRFILSYERANGN